MTDNLLIDLADYDRRNKDYNTYSIIKSFDFTARKIDETIYYAADNSREPNFISMDNEHFDVHVNRVVMAGDQSFFTTSDRQRNYETDKWEWHSFTFSVGDVFYRGDGHNLIKLNNKDAMDIIARANKAAIIHDDTRDKRHGA